MNSKIVTVEVECEVFYREEVETHYGSDADGNRGMALISKVPITVQILTKVPKECEAFLKAAVIDAFEEQVNG